MTESTLKVKAQAFVSTLAPEETAKLRQIAQANSGQDEVKGYALGAAPGASGPAEGVTWELPAHLVDKLREFAKSLSPDELSELQPAGQAQDGEVHGYVAVNTPHESNNPTYKEFVNGLTQYVAGVVGVPFKL